ncbi:ATP-binding cassette domain-containing protein [Amycolatopsis roodepoortensis]|uniref:ABC transporter ATP-binding protein n=1 Tax=Amycolatopsis TaxID=1813 RepID=UPI001B860C6E|nr:MULTISPECIES: ATP-binding cassette domain-containing protein [Amycolatopsis]
MPGFLLDRVTVTRGPTRLLDGVCARLPAGACTAVVGPSGAGKSTLLRLLNRLEDPSTGQILLNSTPLAELEVLALRRRVGLVAQQPVLLTNHVAEELRVGRAELTEHRIQHLLDLVGLPARFAQRRTSGLSGGEAQRVCLARTLAVEPEVLLLDEPTAALDAVTTAVITEAARNHTAAGGTVILVSHDLPLVRGIAEHVLVLHHGRLVAHGHPDHIDYLEAG